MKVRMRVRNARRKKNMTLQQLAAITGISVSSLSRFETGKTQFRNVDVEDLLQAIRTYEGAKTYERKAGTAKD